MNGGKIVKINTCPRCGSDVVLRKGKYGEFIGCSQYPKCDWTTSVETWTECGYDPEQWLDKDFYDYPGDEFLNS